MTTNETITVKIPSFQSRLNNDSKKIYQYWQFQKRMIPVIVDFCLTSTIPDLIIMKIISYYYPFCGLSDDDLAIRLYLYQCGFHKLRYST